ncbi:MAT1-2-1 [Purpureocillium lavendulum]|uniref:MAT1-2-1 n=1 Tax=Purpureocillium lavendulum TaxID=1247861 RepID=A0AB34G1J4_9HYPO|nr:MAT1-2-1 [Purpureocillium lavendulum]
MAAPGIIGTNGEAAMQRLQVTWAGLEMQVSPFTQVLVIPGVTFRQLDESGRGFIAGRFMQSVRESVLYILDGSGNDRVYLGAPRHFVAGGGTVLRAPGHGLFWVRRTPPQTMTATVISPPVPAKHVKIPRPPNAYILYRKERHHLVKAANPGITNNEISQILGKAWNGETEEIRKKYKDMSLQVKQALLEKHPDYQYRPRRPSERRRRRRSTHSSSLRRGAGNGNPVSSPGSPSADSPADSIDDV